MLDSPDATARMSFREGGIEVFSSGHTGPLVELETPWADVTLQEELSVTGHTEQWLSIQTRPAFEVACISREGGELYVRMITKRRKATDTNIMPPRLPGGYLWEDTEAFMLEKIRRETGLVIVPGSLKDLRSMIGHVEIRTPIRLYYTADWNWRSVAGHADGIQLIRTTLESAVDGAFRGEVENDSTFSALMRLYYMLHEGQLNV